MLAEEPKGEADNAIEEEHEEACVPGFDEKGGYSSRTGK